MKKALLLSFVIVLMSCAAVFACDTCGCSAAKAAGEAGSHMHEEKMAEKASSASITCSKCGAEKVCAECGAKAVEGTNLSTKKAKEASSN